MDRQRQDRLAGQRRRRTEVPQSAFSADRSSQFDHNSSMIGLARIAPE
jgi:hypothetical protein